MNGRVGRVKKMAQIKRGIEREASAAGVDVIDRAAVKRWHDARMAEMLERIQRNSGKTVDQWT